MEIFMPFRKDLIVLLCFVGVLETLSLAPPYFLGKLVNAMQAKGPVTSSILIATSMLAIYLSIGLIQRVYNAHEVRSVSFDIPRFLTSKTLSKILELSIGQNQSQSSGITQSVVSQGQSALYNLLQMILFEILPLLVRVLVTVTALVFFNGFVGVVVVCGLSVYTMYSTFLTKKFRTKMRKLQDLGHKNNKAQREILANAPLVQVHVQEDRIQKEADARAENFGNEGKNLWLSYFNWGSLREVITSLMRFSTLIIGIFLVSKGYSVGDFIVIVYWTNLATSDIITISRIQRQWLDLSTSIEKYLEILAVESNIKTIPNPVSLDALQGRIRFEDVSFSYPNLSYITVSNTREDEEDEEEKPCTPDAPALTHVSFDIHAGETVAFVGMSGAGKSTIMKLLLRAYDPDGGRVLIDGYDIRTVDLEQYRRSVGLVDQRVVLFDGSLKYNIQFGVDQSNSFDVSERLAQVTRDSRVDEFLPSLKNGLETRIGENGTKLSGGQGQRAGIARALMMNPRILILDEATSSLDAVNEFLIKEAIDAASTGRTTVVIAHRLSTVRDADRIFVMDKGCLIASGPHNVLLETCVVYRELVEKQLFSA